MYLTFMGMKYLSLIRLFSLFRSIKQMSEHVETQQEDSDRKWYKYLKGNSLPYLGRDKTKSIASAKIRLIFV